ncbi:MAG: energy transducer TonB [Thermoanaerobaculia bacterium]
MARKTRDEQANRGRRQGARLAVILAILTALAGTHSAAQRTVQRLGRQRPEVILRWQQTLEESDLRLQAGEWKRVRKMTNRLLNEIGERVERGPVAPYLASAAAQRGIAEAALGNDRKALWAWEMAVALNPDLAELDLTLYGEGGARLLRQREARQSTEFVLLTMPGAEPPRKLAAPSPTYPRAKKIACLEQSIVVDSIIDAEGLPQRPQLRSAAYPVLGFAAMEALRDWRFEPARLDGRAVPVKFSLQANFKIKLCQTLVLAIRARGHDKAETAEEVP